MHVAWTRPIISLANHHAFSKCRRDGQLYCRSHAIRRQRPCSDVTSRTRTNGQDIYEDGSLLNLPDLRRDALLDGGTFVGRVPARHCTSISRFFNRFRISLTLGARCWRMNSWRQAISSYLADMGSNPSQAPAVKGAHVAQTCLNAVFDDETILLISKQAHRMCLYDAKNADKPFDDKLSENDVKNLMKNRVSAS